MPFEAPALAAVPAVLNFAVKSAQTGFELQQVPEEIRALFKTIKSVRSDILNAYQRRVELAKDCQPEDFAEWDRGVSEAEAALTDLEKLVEPARLDTKHKNGKIKAKTRLLWVMKHSKSLSAASDRLNLAHQRMLFATHMPQMARGSGRRNGSYQSADDNDAPPPYVAHHEPTKMAVAERRNEDKERIAVLRSLSDGDGWWPPAAQPDTTSRSILNGQEEARFGHSLDRYKSIEQRTLSAPETQTVIPRAITPPRRESTLARRETTLPRRETILPRRDTTLPRRETLLPRRDTTLPRRDTTLPRRDTTLPRRDTTLPRRDTTLPQRDIILPQRQATPPRLQTIPPIEPPMPSHLLNPILYRQTSNLMPSRTHPSHRSMSCPYLPETHSMPTQTTYYKPDPDPEPEPYYRSNPSLPTALTQTRPDLNIPDMPELDTKPMSSSNPAQRDELFFPTSLSSPSRQDPSRGLETLIPTGTASSRTESPFPEHQYDPPLRTAPKSKPRQPPTSYRAPPRPPYPPSRPQSVTAPVPSAYPETPDDIVQPRQTPSSAPPRDTVPDNVQDLYRALNERSPRTVPSTTPDGITNTQASFAGHKHPVNVRYQSYTDDGNNVPSAGGNAGARRPPPPPPIAYRDLGYSAYRPGDN